MSKYQEIIDKLPFQEVFLINTFEEIAIRSVPDRSSKFYAKPRGKQEYFIDHSTALVNETLMEANEITKDEYYKY